MGKSYNNVIRLTEMFSGDSSLLDQAYSPMTIRFFILQTHYRSTLDFGNEALKAAEKGLKRLMEAYKELLKLEFDPSKSVDEELESIFMKHCREFDENMNDDFNTAKVLANMFSLVNYINSFRNGSLEKTTLSQDCLSFVKKQFSSYLLDIFGLKEETSADNEKIKGVMDLLIQIRKEARNRKDYATSDKIRNQLLELGILIKDEKDGMVSYTFN
jgi:cysteinyl-tRNA synthetase